MNNEKSSLSDRLYAVLVEAQVPTTMHELMVRIGRECEDAVASMIASRRVTITRDYKLMATELKP